MVRFLGFELLGTHSTASGDVQGYCSNLTDKNSRDNEVPQRQGANNHSKSRENIFSSTRSESFQ
jgi:hypothetical protein